MAIKYYLYFAPRGLIASGDDILKVFKKALLRQKEHYIFDDLDLARKERDKRQSMWAGDGDVYIIVFEEGKQYIIALGPYTQKLSLRESLMFMT